MSSATPIRPQAGMRVWWHFKDWLVDAVGDDGSLVLLLVRRGGQMRCGLTSQEVEREIASGELRPYYAPKQLDLFDQGESK